MRLEGMERYVCNVDVDVDERSNESNTQSNFAIRSAVNRLRFIVRRNGLESDTPGMCLVFHALHRIIEVKCMFECDLNIRVEMSS